MMIRKCTKQGAENVTDDNKTKEERKLYFTRERKDVGFIERVVRILNVYLNTVRIMKERSVLSYGRTLPKMHS